jgi:TRAP-type mannitol/chloroaromatic compound transport system permease small subunit
VRVDIFYRDAIPRRRALVDLLGTVIFLLPMAGLILWVSLPYVARSWAIFERSQEAAGLPAVFLLKTAIPVFALLLILQGVAEAIRAADVLRGGAKP